MKKYLLLVDILPFWSGMSRGKMYVVFSFLVQKACSVGIYIDVPKRQVRYQAALSLYFNQNSGSDFPQIAA
jgi:hypothetical protein